MSIDPNIVIPAGMFAVAGLSVGLKYVNGKPRTDCKQSRKNREDIVRLQTQYENIDQKLERILDKVNGKT